MIALFVFCDWFFPKNTTTVTITITGSLSTAKFSPKEIEVKKGEIILFKPQENGVILRNPTIGEKSILSMTDVITFSQPGKKDDFYLGSTDIETKIIIQEDGFLRFGAKFPDFLTDFATAKKVSNGVVTSPITIEVKKTEERYQKKTTVEPKVIAYGGGLIGTLFPEMNVEKKGEIKEGKAEWMKGWNNKNIRSELKKFFIEEDD